MVDDYRNTEYCTPLGNVSERKQEVAECVKKDHPRAKDMHNYISINDGPYKIKFIRAYNEKCAYCGVSLDIIPQSSFEIDHFIFKESPEFKHKKDAGYMENLVLACHKCNHAKSSLEIPVDARRYLHPDKPEFIKTFVRDEDFYIRISDKKKNDTATNDFYNKLGLVSESHRLDYLLLSMKGLKNNISSNLQAVKLLSETCDLLQKKRNEIG